MCLDVIKCITGYFDDEIGLFLLKNKVNSYVFIYGVGILNKLCLIECVDISVLLARNSVIF